MAPEILLDRSYDQSADLWSIGVILYECLFGNAPYSSKSLEELLEKIKKKQKIEIPKTKSISSNCEDLLLRLLVHDPKQRISFSDFFQHEFLNLKCHENNEVSETFIFRLRCRPSIFFPFILRSREISGADLYL